MVQINMGNFMALPLTLTHFIIKNQTAQASGTFTSIMEDVALACRMTASKLRYGNFDGLMTKSTVENASGDQQVPLDILANNIFMNLAENNGNIVAIASEELEEIHYFPKAKGAKYILVIDPLDGSGNLDINAPVATIFSICRNPVEGNPTQEEILEAARAPVAAGVCIYGLATSMAMTTGNGVHGFTLDLESGAFFYTHPNMQIKETAKEVAINFSNKSYWNPAITQYIDEVFAGKEGPRGRQFNTRWYASAAAELYRILNRGGVFIYPACSNGKPKGVLRKLYEAWPMAYLVEAAGGKATDGKQRILDITASDLHERTPFAMGTSEELDRLSDYHKEIN
jgi:fructose-1,6-bisphosphatase I